MNPEDFRRMLRDPHTDPVWGVVDEVPFNDGYKLAVGHYDVRPVVAFAAREDFKHYPSEGTLTRYGAWGPLLVYDEGQWFGDSADVDGSRGTPQRLSVAEFNPNRRRTYT